MIELLIILVFSLLLTLLGIKFGFAQFVAAFSSIFFLIAFLAVIFSYFKHYPDVTIEIQPINKYEEFNDMYELRINIRKNKKGVYHYQSLYVYPANDTVPTSDINTEVTAHIRTSPKEKLFPNPAQIFPLNNYRSETETVLGSHTFPLVVVRDKEDTVIKVILNMNRNPYEAGILAAFNPIYNYSIKQDVYVDFSKTLNILKERAKQKNK